MKLYKSREKAKKKTLGSAFNFASRVLAALLAGYIAGTLRPQTIHNHYYYYDQDNRTTTPPSHP